MGYCNNCPVSRGKSMAAATLNRGTWLWRKEGTSLVQNGWECPPFRSMMIVPICTNVSPGDFPASHVMFDYHRLHPIQPHSVRLNSINVGKTIINYLFGNGYHHLDCILFYATLPTIYLYLMSRRIATICHRRTVLRLQRIWHFDPGRFDVSFRWIIMVYINHLILY